MPGSARPPAGAGRPTTPGQPDLSPSGSLLARLAVRLVLAAVRAVLAELNSVRVVTPVLPRDVVAVLAFLTRQGDLGPDICRSHSGMPFSVRILLAAATRLTARAPRGRPRRVPVDRPSGLSSAGPVRRRPPRVAARAATAKRRPRAPDGRPQRRPDLNRRHSDYEPLALPD